MKLILATGIPELEEYILEHIRGLFKETQSVLFLQALTVVDVNEETTVLISDSIQNSGDDHIMSVVEYLRRNNVRIVFVGMERPAWNPMVQALLHRGVYDLLLSDELSVNDVVDVLQHPLTYRDVAHLFTAQTGLSQSPNIGRRLTIKQENDEKQQEQENTTASLSTPMRLFRKNKQGLEPKIGPKTIIVSGLCGAGVSFVALHKALALSSSMRVALVEASERPVFSRWLNGPQSDNGANELAAKKTPERAWWYNENLRIYSASTEGPRLKTIVPLLDTLDVDTVIVDARLEEVRSYRNVADILVVPPDPIKIEYAAGVEVTEIVVNMAPTPLPVDIGEYGALFGGVKLQVIPFIPSQSLAVVSGRHLEVTEVQGSL